MVHKMEIEGCSNGNSNGKIGRRNSIESRNTKAQRIKVGWPLPSNTTWLAWKPPPPTRTEKEEKSFARSRESRGKTLELNNIAKF